MIPATQSEALLSTPLWIGVALLVIVILADVAARARYGRFLGSAFLTVVLGAAAANFGILPSAAAGGPVYDQVFNVVAPAALFLLLLQANYKALRRVGRPMFLAFAIGAIGVFLGVLLAFAITPARELLSPHGPAMAGMLAGTYIGGSANYNAVALQYGINKAPQLYAAGVVVDNLMTNVWMLTAIVAPPLMIKSRLFKSGPTAELAPESEEKVGPPTLFGLAIALAAALAALGLSGLLHDLLAQAGVDVPFILILTVLGICAAQAPGVQGLGEATPLGLLGIYLFLAVVGASADVAALFGAGSAGLLLFAFISIVFATHAVVLVSLAAILKLDPDVVAVSSAANIGGSSTALAIAELRGRPDLVVPGILAGLIGTSIGTFVGVGVATLLGGGT